MSIAPHHTGRSDGLVVRSPVRSQSCRSATKVAQAASQPFRFLWIAEHPELYEPLPDLAALPGWLWRKTSRPVRVAIGLVLVGAIVAAVLVAPGIGQSKRERETAEAHARAEHHARLVRAQRIEQTPRFRETRQIDPGTGAASARLAARVRLVADMRPAILADARRRERAGELDGPLRRVASSASRAPSPTSAPSATSPRRPPATPAWS